MDQRNLILAIVLSVSILLGFQIFVEGPRIEEERARMEAQKEQQKKTNELRSVSEGKETAPTAPASTSPLTIPGSSAPIAGQSFQKPAFVRKKILSKAPRVKIFTDRVIGSINLKGALIDDLILRGYRQNLKKDSEQIVLLSPKNSPDPYYAQFGWISQTPGVDLPGPNTVWKSATETLSRDQPVTLSWVNRQGLEFKQTISIDENYMFSVRKVVRNQGNTIANLHAFGLVSQTGTPETSEFWILHEGLIGAFNETLKEIDFDDIQEEKGGIISQTSIGGWIGITAKYFATALVPNQKTQNTSRFIYTNSNGKDRYQIDYLANAQALNPGGEIETTTHFFAGAKEVRLLDSYEEKFSIPVFDKLVDFGWFYYLTKPIFYAIEYFYRILGNFGLAILLLTVLIKIAFFPLANKSYRSMSRLKKLQPKMVEIRERYKDDRQRQNQAMMELYKKEGANPMSGCFPILIQIPVFFALYKVLFVTIEMRHAPFFGWIQDLSAPDPLGLLTFFGLFTWDVPTSLQIVNIGIWPIIMGLTMFLQQKLNPQPADPMQQKIFMILPIVFTFLLGQFPAGLVIYWAWNNLLSIAQQWLIMRQMGITASGETIKSAATIAPPRGNKKHKDENINDTSNTATNSSRKSEKMGKKRTRRQRKRR